uniref:Uncharacterized protein n=1 Tax=Anguilla anguilla TaxID=7936 RepID=A0A0E9QAE1_ANGAN
MINFTGRSVPFTCTGLQASMPETQMHLDY